MLELILIFLHHWATFPGIEKLASWRTLYRERFILVSRNSPELNHVLLAEARAHGVHLAPINGVFLVYFTCAVGQDVISRFVDAQSRPQR